MNLTSTLDPCADIAQPNYSATHLEFRRDTIEPLPTEAVFEVETPAGIFRMTKGEFHSEFPEIVSSVSYRDLGLYHYPMIPYKAFRFLTREPKAAAAGSVLAVHPFARVDQQQEQPVPDGSEERIDQIPGQ